MAESLFTLHPQSLRQRRAPKTPEIGSPIVRGYLRYTDTPEAGLPQADRRPALTRLVTTFALSDRTMLGRLLILILSVLPTHGMSRLVGWLGNRSIRTSLRPTVYRAFSRVFGAVPEEAELALSQYGTLNAFFTRALAPGLRPVAPNALVSPVDGTVGASGTVADDVLLQAKGRNYSLAALLGDAALAHRLDGGSFITLYLAPKDYHRVHVPVEGEIVAATYIPGKLWPVNVHAVMHVADLFAVNERIVVTIRSDGGVLVVVLVGATMVGMTRVAFDDLHTNARRRDVQRRTYDPPIPVVAGGPLGHFEFGSTVILVCSPDCGSIEPLPEHRAVRMGQRIGALAQPEHAAAR